MFRNLILFSLLCLSPVVATAQNTPQQTAMAFIEAISARDAAATIALLADDTVLEMSFPLAEGKNAYGTRPVIQLSSSNARVITYVAGTGSDTGTTTYFCSRSPTARSHSGANTSTR